MSVYLYARINGSDPTDFGPCKRVTNFGFTFCVLFRSALLTSHKTMNSGEGSMYACACVFRCLPHIRCCAPCKMCSICEMETDDAVVYITYNLYMYPWLFEQNKQINSFQVDMAK